VGLRRRAAASCLAAACLGAALLATGAEACDSAACALATRGAEGALAPGRWRLDVSFRYVDEGRGRFGGRPVDEVWHRRVDLARGALEPSIHRAIGGTLSLALVDVARGLSRRVSVRAALPLFRRQTIDSLHPFRIQDETRGIGDFQLGTDVVLLSRGSGVMTAGATVKLPTGPSAVAGRDGVVDPMIQAGTGSVDGVASLQLLERVGSASLSATASFQKTTASGSGYRHGDEAVVAVAAVRPLAGGLTGTVQVKFQQAARHRFRGVDVLATGSSGVQVIAGARLRVAGAALHASVQIPAYTRVNESQLTARVAVVAGVVKAF
jgi:hypothetical protein